MEENWQVTARWVDRDGRRTEHRFHFPDRDRARKEVVRLFCRLGEVGADDRALTGLDITGDFWAADRVAGATAFDGDTRPG